MGFFNSLFGSKEPSPAPAPTFIPQPAPSGKIGYDPKLIESMLHDHAQLGQIFGRIGELQQAGAFTEVPQLLAQFKSRLQAHILTENVRFYTYLQQSLAGDPDNARTMHDFRREMNDIAHGVVEFVRKYQSSTFTPGERRQFATDYAAVGKLLEQRLDNEENSLYPLYQPS